MRHRYRLFGVLVPAMMLAGVACAAAVPAPSPVSSTAASPTTAAATASPALPQADDLTFGQDAGKVLVGLTVRPAQPGPNTLLVYVLPLEGPAAAADVPLSLALGGRRVPIDKCPRNCRRPNLTRTGAQHLGDIAAGPASVTQAVGQTRTRTHA